LLLYCPTGRLYSHSLRRDLLKGSSLLLDCIYVIGLASHFPPPARAFWHEQRNTPTTMFFPRSLVLAALLAANAATAAFSGDARPDDPPNAGADTALTAVIELFTSQGCSSCPPADVLLQSYVGRKGILALSMPVDYWDYLGWKDTLGSAKHTERQRNYAKQRGDGQIYTPQAVINGVRHVNGASAREIDAALSETEAQSSAIRVPLRFWTDRGRIFIDAGGAAEGTAPKEATVWLAVIQKTVDVTVEQGENRGKTLTYVNVVRELTPVGTWTGQPLRIQLARSALMRPQLEAVAVLIQQGKAGPIIGAAMTGLW
jgi:hypothetical protein